MVAKTSHVDYKGHIEHIEKHTTYNAHSNLRIVNRKLTGELSEFDGVTPAIEEMINLSKERQIGAGAHVAADDLAKQIASAREAGNATDDLKSTVRFSTIGGSTEVIARATRTRRIPRALVPGTEYVPEEVTKHGVITVSIDANKRIPEEAINYSRQLITKSLGLPDTE